jgi:hypothetical protein
MIKINKTAATAKPIYKPVCDVLGGLGAGGIIGGDDVGGVVGGVVGLVGGVDGLVGGELDCLQKQDLADPGCGSPNIPLLHGVLDAFA